MEKGGKTWFGVDSKFFGIFVEEVNGCLCRKIL